MQIETGAKSADWVGVSGFLLKTNLRGGDNRLLFFKTIGYRLYCSFYCFFENFRGANAFWGEFVVEGRPLPPYSRNPACVCCLSRFQFYRHPYEANDRLLTVQYNVTLRSSMKNLGYGSHCGCDRCECCSGQKSY